MAAKRILIVDDEENIGRSLRLILEREGFVVNLCTSVAQFQTIASTIRADVYMLDVRLPDGSGMDILRQLRQNDSPAAVIMISGHATISEAVEATKIGAVDFVEKPLGRDRVLLAIRNALEQSTLRQENARLKELVPATIPMIGASNAWRRVLEQATMAARSDARILLNGESGTGKELLAAHIHESSPFSSGPFVKVNCAAIPTELIESELFGHEKGAFTGAANLRRGKFELADGGSLFLDEVGDLHSNSQAKLLRVLQEGEFHRVGGEQLIRVSVRVVAATNRDLGAMVSQQQFREDLFYRLSVVPLRVPPLRERSEDVALLAIWFLDEFCRRNNFRPRTISDEAMELLESYSWPGNVRELKNTVERMAILSAGEVLTVESVPLELRLAEDSGPANSVEQARRNAEKEHIMRALEQTNWNVSSAARVLGMERTNLHKRMRTLGVARP